MRAVLKFPVKLHTANKSHLLVSEDFLQTYIDINTSPIGSLICYDAFQLSKKLISFCFHSTKRGVIICGKLQVV